MLLNVVINSTNDFEDNGDVLIFLWAVFDNFAHFQWLELDQFVVVAHGQVVYHFLDFGVEIILLQVANTLNYSNVDFLTVLVGGRKVLIFDLLIDSIIFDLITFILLLFFVLIDHKSIGLEICSLRLLKSKVLLN